MKMMVIDRIKTVVYPSAAQLGQAAAQEMASCIRERLINQPELNLLFSAGRDMAELYRALREEDIAFDRLNAFVTGEMGGGQAACAAFLKQELFDRVRFASVNLLDGQAPQAEECARYAALLREHPLDIACLCIGEGGRLGMLEERDGDQEDVRLVRPVQLGGLPALGLSLQALLSTRVIFCLAVGGGKARAVGDALRGEASQCPAASLRRHGAVTLYLDTESARRLG